MYDALFEIQVQICKTFPSLDPIRLRQQKCGEVLLLLRRMIRYNNIQEERKAEDGNAVPAVPADDDVIIVRKKNGDTITMRRARDDSAW